MTAMTSMNRSEGRNVFFYSEKDPKVILGGLIQNGSVTCSNFLSILGVLIVLEPPLSLFIVVHRESGNRLEESEDPLPTGSYDIISTGDISITDEPWVPRVFSYSVTGREESFKRDVRSRDGGCVLTGQVNPRPNKSWSGFVAAHIFPIQHESLFQSGNYGRWIDQRDDGGSKINSPQNGLLMAVTVHFDFDNFLVGINPDDGYKITCFDEDAWHVDGRILSSSCRQDGDALRVSDHLLRWHFRQCVFANIRGAGEPIWEHDFPAGSDEIAEIAAGPLGKARLELELAARLNNVMYLPAEHPLPAEQPRNVFHLQARHPYQRDLPRPRK